MADEVSDLAYVAQHACLHGLSELRDVSAADRETLKRWAREERELIAWARAVVSE